VVLLYLFPPLLRQCNEGSMVLRLYMCVSLYVCKANSRPAACKLRVTCEAAATLYGEHSISVQLDPARHSGSREARVCERVTVCGSVYF